MNRFSDLVGFDEELQLHLLEFTRPKNEVPRCHLVAECLTNLCDTKGHLLARGLVDIFELCENRLSRFRPEISHVILRLNGPDIGLKHQVEGSRFG